MHGVEMRKRVDKLLIGVITTLALLFLSASVFAIYANLKNIKNNKIDNSILVDVAADEDNVYITVSSTENETTKKAGLDNLSNIDESSKENISLTEESISQEEITNPEEEIEYDINANENFDADEDANVTSSSDSIEDLILDVAKINSPEDGSNIIILDPGHGGSDPGKDVGTVYEKDINLAVALIAKDVLENAGYNVLMTRDSDVYMSLNDRVYFENQYYDALFVSIHCNSNMNSSVNGIELYYYNSSDEASNFAYYFASSGYNIKSMYNDYRVLKYATESSLLIELGFLSNEDDFKLLTDSGYQSIIAHDLANAIIYTLSNK